MLLLLLLPLPSLQSSLSDAAQFFFPVDSSRVFNKNSFFSFQTDHPSFTLHCQVLPVKALKAMVTARGESGGPWK